MPSKPGVNDLIPDEDVERLVICVCKRPGMYVRDPSFSAVCAYFDGFNQARNGGPLIGLHQWLVVKSNDGKNVVWSALAEARIRAASRVDKTAEEMIAALGDLLVEFIVFRRTAGITRVFYDYGKWLLRRSWYDGPLRQTWQPPNA